MANLPGVADKEMERYTRTKKENIQYSITKHNIIFDEQFEVMYRGSGMLAIVIGASNTHLIVHHVSEAGVPNFDTDVDFATATAIANVVAAGDVPPMTYNNIAADDPNTDVVVAADVAGDKS